MKDKLTYSKIRKVFPILAMVCFFIIYKLSLSETIEVIISVNELEDKKHRSKEVPQRIEYLKSSLNKYKTATLFDTTGNYQQELLEMVSLESKKNGLLLKDFPINTLDTTSQTLKLNTHKFTIEGDFISSITLINHIEKHFLQGKISSIEMELKQERKTKRKFLETTVYIQNLLK